MSSMNRDSLPNEILYLPPIDRIHLNGDEYVKYNAVLDKVDNAYELQKPEIPKFVADWIEEVKQRGCGLADALNCFESPIMPEKVKQWIQFDFAAIGCHHDNQELLAKAWLNGYTIEKEPVWVVKDDDMYLISLSVLYDGDRVNSYFHVLDDNFDRPRVFRNKEEAEAARILAAKGTVKEWSE